MSKYIYSYKVRIRWLLERLDPRYLDAYENGFLFEFLSCLTDNVQIISLWHFRNAIVHGHIQPGKRINMIVPLLMAIEYATQIYFYSQSIIWFNEDLWPQKNRVVISRLSEMVKSINSEFNDLLNKLSL